MRAFWIMIPVALLMGSGFLIVFIIAAWKGQFDDLDSPQNQTILNPPLETNQKEMI